MRNPILYEDVEVLKVIDGDTAHLKINIFIDKQFFIGPCRLLGINAPELHVDRKLNPAGVDAKAALLEWLKKPIKVAAKSEDKFGRPLITIWAKETIAKKVVWTNVNEWMLENKFAKRMGLQGQKIQDEMNEKTLPKNFKK